MSRPHSRCWGHSLEPLAHLKLTFYVVRQAIRKTMAYQMKGAGAAVAGGAGT